MSLPSIELEKGGGLRMHQQCSLVLGVNLRRTLFSVGINSTSYMQSKYEHFALDSNFLSRAYFLFRLIDSPRRKGVKSEFSAFLSLCHLRFNQFQGTGVEGTVLPRLIRASSMI